MTKTYVYGDDTFAAWRNVTNLHTDQIGDDDHKKLNSSMVSAYADQQWISDHVNVVSLSVTNVTAGSSVDISGSAGYGLRPGMKVIAYLGALLVSDDLCSILSVAYSSGGVTLTLSHALSFSPSPSTLSFTFQSTVISKLNDLEFSKLNRNGDRMTEALVIDSLTTAEGTLTTNETTFNLVNTTATSLNFAGAGTNINIGATTGSATIKNSAIVLGQLATGSTTIQSPAVNISTGSTGVASILSTKASTSSSDGSLVVSGGTGIAGALNVAGVAKIENVTDNTLGSLASGATQIAGGMSVSKNLTIGSDLRVKGGDITVEGSPTILSTVTTNPVAIFNTTTGLITIGANQTTSIAVNGNVTLNTNSGNSVNLLGQTLSTSNTTFNLLNATATTINFGGAATTVSIGASTGTTTFNSATVSTTSANGSLVASGGVGVAGALNVAGVTKFENIADNTLGSLDGGLQTLGGMSVSKNLTIGSDLRIKGGDITVEGSPNIQAVTTTNPANIFNTTTGLITIGANQTTSVSVQGNVTLNTNSGNSVSLLGQTLSTTNTTFNLINTTATTINFGGAATTFSIGAATGTTTVNNDLNLAAGKVFKINGVSVLSNTTIGSSVLASSLTSVGVLVNLTVAGNTAVNGGDITTTAVVASLFNTSATTVSIGGSATTVSIGASTGTTTVNNDLNITIGKVYKINGVSVLSNNTLGSGVVSSSLTSVGTLTTLTIGTTANINNGVLATTSASASLFNTSATTVSIGGSATTVSIGAVTGTTSINNTVKTPQLDVSTNGSMLSGAANVSTTSETTIFTLDKTIYRSAEVVIQAKQGTQYYVTKIIMMHDGTDSFESEFGSLGTALGTFNTNISGNNWTMAVSQFAATATEYKIIITAVKV